MKPRILFISTLLLVLINDASAQVPKRIVIEHFTNSKCGICASKNPGFYENLSNFPGVIHLSIHPSKPYADCIFHQHNPDETDERANFYGVFGSTPRFVIQGQQVPASTDVSKPNFINNASGDSSAFEMKLKQYYGSSFDTVHVRLTVSKVGASSLSQATLFGALAESEIEYEAPNGEAIHYDVFRTALFGAGGSVIDLPVNVGDSFVVQTETTWDNTWLRDQVFAMALLQDTATKEVIQAVSGEGTVITSVNCGPAETTFAFYPNPANRQLTVVTPCEQGPALFQVFDLKGVLAHSLELTGYIQAVDISHLSAGLYVVTIQNGSASYVTPLIIE